MYLQGAMCSVFLPEEDRVVNIICDHLEPVIPKSGDDFKVRKLIILLYIMKNHLKSFNVYLSVYVCR